MPSRVGVWLSLKLRVTSYTAFTVKQSKNLISKRALLLSVVRCERLCTCVLQTVQRGGESFGSGQQVVFELGQTFTLCNLHTDLMLLLCKASSFTIQQKLRRVKKSVSA